MSMAPMPMVGLTFGVLYVEREVETPGRHKWFVARCTRCGVVRERPGQNIRRAVRLDNHGCACKPPLGSPQRHVTEWIRAGEKPCCTCKVVKPFSEFGRDRKRRDGTYAQCKDCQKSGYRKWRKDRGFDQIAKDRARARAAVRHLRLVEDPRYQLFKSARWRARRMGIEFRLTLDDIVIPERCPVLGLKFRSGMGRGYGHDLKYRDRAPSLDRIDNKRGYTPDNVIIVSYRANRLKSDATVEELEAVATFYRALVDSKRLSDAA